MNNKGIFVWVRAYFVETKIWESVKYVFLFASEIKSQNFHAVNTVKLSQSAHTIRVVH